MSIPHLISILNVEVDTVNMAVSLSVQAATGWSGGKTVIPSTALSIPITVSTSSEYQLSRQSDSRLPFRVREPELKAALTRHFSRWGPLRLIFLLESDGHSAERAVIVYSVSRNSEID